MLRDNQCNLRSVCLSHVALELIFGYRHICMFPKHQLAELFL